MGDEFEQVYAQHLAPVWRFVRARIPVADDAEDLTSEVFARAARAWESYDRDRGPVGAWLAGIARHLVADWWRRRAKEVPWQDVDAVARPADEQTPEAAAISSESRAELRRHLAMLTDKERDAIALRFGAGLKAAEVGAVLGVSETAARMLVYRAVSKLRGVMMDG